MKVIFLDRDGVINKEVGYLHKIEDFEFINGVFDACLDFQSSGYKIIIVTNQSGIERGFYIEKDFHTVTDWMLNQFKDYGVNILDVYYCPHGPESNCDCRKPKTGLFIQAKKDLNIVLEKSWVIGDSTRDILAAQNAGMKSILVRTGHAGKDSSYEVTPDFVAKDLSEAVKLILKEIG